MGEKPTVCYFGTYRKNYARNQIIVNSLRRAGVRVVECHEPLWHGTEDRVALAGGQWARFSFFKRAFRSYKRLIEKYFSMKNDYDVMMLGYPGQLDIFLARVLTWIRGRKLVFDGVMSIYLVSLERELQKKSPVTIRLLRWVEFFGCRLADLIICDTPHYLQWYVKTHGLRCEKIRLVPLGADERVFFCRKPALDKGEKKGKFNALYYGTFIRNHGVETIIEAANLLKSDRRIRFEFAGKGPEKKRAMELARVHGLENVKFLGWINKQDLPSKVQRADLVLGSFGTTPQATMTVHNKVFETLAMGKPILTGISPGIESFFTNKQHGFFVERSNPEALAKGILCLCNDTALTKRLSCQGKSKFDQCFSMDVLGNLLADHLSLVSRNGK